MEFTNKIEYGIIDQFQSYYFQDSVIDALNKITESNSTLPIFLAAFLGSLLAFIFNWIHEYLRERSKQKIFINKTMHLLIVNLQNFYNFKGQFVAPLEDEIKQFASLLECYEYPGHNNELNEWADILSKIFNDIKNSGCRKKNHALVNFIKPWHKPYFYNIPMNDLYFVASESPYLPNHLIGINSMIKLIDDSINIRNKICEKYKVKQEQSNSPYRQLYNYDFISNLNEILPHYSNFTFACDLGILYCKKSSDLLIKYREKHFPKTLHSKIFFFIMNIFKKNKWIKYTIDEKNLYLDPDEEKYKDIFPE